MKQRTNVLSLYSNVGELARDLRMSRVKTYHALRAGVIPSVRIGKRYVISKVAVAEWLHTAGGRIGSVA
jgi:excisionase family DNA binding protein